MGYFASQKLNELASLYSYKMQVILRKLALRRTFREPHSCSWYIMIRIVWNKLRRSLTHGDVVLTGAHLECNANM